jgi:glycosyltransferase involved in cell wall biosynthesis
MLNKESQKKIVFVHLYNSFTGAPNVLANIIKNLDYNNKLLITNRRVGFLTDCNIQKKLFYFELSSLKIITLFMYLVAQVKIGYLTLCSVKEGDLIYINTTLPTLAGLAGRIRKCNVIYHVHEDASKLNFMHRFFSKLRKNTSDLDIYVSNYLAKCDIDSRTENHTVVKNCVSDNIYYQANMIKFPHHLGLRVDSFNILMVCSLRSYKGVFEFLSITNSLYKDIGNGFSSTLVVDASESEINRFFSGYELPVCLSIKSRPSNISSIYMSASLLLNLSKPNEWIETFGLTIIEAMMFGVPSIVPPVGGPAEIVVDSFTGFLIQSDKIDSIVDKIKYLYKNADIYNELVRNCLKCSEEYAPGMFNARIKSIIETYTNC